MTARLSPRLAPALAAGVTVACELATRSVARYGVEAIVTAAALAYALRSSRQLGLRSLLLLALLLPIGIAAAHLLRGVPGDVDVQTVYPAEGDALLHGRYPHAEYPPGAMLLFAFEQLVGRARDVNPFVMAACHAATVWAVWRCRTRWSGWLAAAVAVWPLDAFFWEFKFDLLPTALLAVGLALWLRQRPVAAGAVLGAGTAVKWSPAVAFALVVVWLLSTRRSREALAAAGAFVASFALIVLPFAVWQPSAVWAAVSRQAPRGITPESIWYLPLRLAGKASSLGAIFDAAAVPGWANGAAVATQVLLLAALAVALALRRPGRSGAIALAALGPIAFLTMNKVFSAQYLVTMVVGWAVAAALVDLSRRTVGLVAAAVGAATAANLFVYPIGRAGLAPSALLFALSVVVTGFLAWLAFSTTELAESSSGIATLPVP